MPGHSTVTSFQGKKGEKNATVLLRQSQLLLALLKAVPLLPTRVASSDLQPWEG